MRTDIVVRPCFIDNAERLLFSYRSVYAEARIYTRQLGCKCELVCKKINKREGIYSDFVVYKLSFVHCCNL